jgi:hypothetical protein
LLGAHRRRPPNTVIAPADGSENFRSKILLLRPASESLICRYPLRLGEGVSARGERPEWGRFAGWTIIGSSAQQHRSGHIGAAQCD